MSERGERVNVPILILSLTLSLFLWAVVYAQTTPTEERTIYVDLQWSGLDTEKFAADGPATIPVRIVGSKQQLQQVVNSTCLARVDLHTAQAGVRDFPVVFDRPALLRDLATTDIPLRAKFTIEAKVRRMISIKVENQGQLSNPNLHLGTILVPDKVSVLAPISVQSTLKEAKVYLNLADVDLSRPEPIDAPVRVFDENGREVDPIKNEVRIDPPTIGITPVPTSAPVRKQAFVQVDLRGAPKEGYVCTGYVVVPNKVTLLGSSDYLANLSQIAADPIDLSGLSGNRSFDVQIRRPAGVTSVSPPTVQVRVSVRRAAVPASENNP